MTHSHAAGVNEARVLRLVLASLRMDEDTTDGLQLWRVTRDEIDGCRGCLEHAIGMLAALVAVDMAIEHGPKKAMRQLEKDIACRLDFAARGRRDE